MQNGFEINDGGFGTITVKVATSSVHLECHERFIANARWRSNHGASISPCSQLRPPMGRRARGLQASNPIAVLISQHRVAFSSGKR